MKTLKLPLRIEPGLVALLCAWFYFDPAGTFLPFVCAAALHEAGHLAMLLWLRQPVHSLCLGLQGAVLRTGPLRYRDELLAAAAGPAMNLALLLAFSRTLPRFALVNFCLLAYNLLPFYPLDGGRLLRAVLRTLLPLACSGLGRARRLPPLRRAPAGMRRISDALLARRAVASAGVPAAWAALLPERGNLTDLS